MPSDWVGIGRSYLRLQLAAQRDGYALHPLSQVLQEYSKIENLQQKFHTMLGIKTPSKVQMWVRLGKPEDLDRMLSPRRELEKIIVS